MKQHNQEEQIEDEHELEIAKAVAQAWHGHSSNSSSKSTSEFDAHKRNFKSRPTRFKLEALNIASSSSSSLSLSSSSSRNGGGPARWDFGQSLWDSYEIVAISKKLERGLGLDYSFSVIGEQGRDSKRRKESTRSLRKLFSRNTSERFKEDDIPKG